MNISQYTRFGYRILRVEERIGLTSDFSELRQLLGKAFSDGFIHIAVAFPGDSFLSSRILALLIESAEKVTSRGGSFTVIAPNTQILEVLAIFDLEWTLRTVSSEKDLLAIPAVAQT